MFAPLLLVLLNSFFVYSTCPTLEPPKLCGTSDVTLSPDQCVSQNLIFPNFEPCCPLHVPEGRCVDKTKPACRSMIIDPAMCPDETGLGCFNKALTMKFYFGWQSTNQTCCSKCRCYGDPHCESFDGSVDTWVICDARTPKIGKPSQCPMTKNKCLSQKDHMGNPCTWHNPSNGPWNVGLLGSPCIPNPAQTVLPEMSMYKTDNFDINLIMGERSIISELRITDGENKYHLTATNCFKLTDGSIDQPWTDENGNTQSSLSWLPNKFKWYALDGGDIYWEVVGLEALVDVFVRCTRTPEVIKGVVNFGPPRLNVDITEPKNYLDMDIRPNADGFCPKGKIAKQGSTENTDMILANNWCTHDVDDLDVAQILCGGGTTTAGISGCQLRWCIDSFGDSFRGRCTTEILAYGWDATFCSAVAFGKCDPNSPTPCKSAPDCRLDNKCRECQNYIKDFGWKSAVSYYQDFGGGDDSACANPLTYEDLPSDLVSDCQQGVRVQYFNSFIGDWVTKFAIPEGACLKDGYVTLTKENDLALFVNRVRVIQCSNNPQSQCLSDKCATEDGFTARFELDVQVSEEKKIIDLYYGGALVCDPVKYPNNPQGCFDVPTSECPCAEQGRRQLLNSVVPESSSKKVFRTKNN